MTDYLIEHFTDLNFQSAFKQYFRELDVNVRDWDGLFAEMDDCTNGKNLAYLRKNDNGDIVGFVLFNIMNMEGWFFRADVGFIRELWIAEPYRQQGHGGKILALAEAWYVNRGIRAVLLTTDTADEFYRHRGYRRRPEITARNKDRVYSKEL